MSPLIQLHDITKTYITGETTLLALNHVNLTINEHELVAIVGESGSGKSTMLHTLGLLDKPTSGSYLLNGKEVAKLNDDELSSLRNLKMGFAFQAFFLLPRFDAIHNVMLPLLYRGVNLNESKERALQILDKLSMTKFKYQRPNQMSGGQQQRVAIARALIGNPDIVFADEPTGALDSKTSKEIIDVFIKLYEEEKKTVIMVTHDIKIALQCRRMITVKDGKIVNDVRDEERKA
ncbi:MAG: macrolide ABC transporter ATP-binding protein [Gammaproteobacteria bacterium RIFCSPHIGHO2_02_FULL_42_13]|nr:MAG: macrolide ABC transporter ATP-binding protein [Gammaproteobacteria bacterium RIFCSPHIGHO2_02_FULL_42_13]OGT71081.1 MAG: macrolide ABC transporter ATP-binding protein [Gammaproteobacteria bacterium RIFCSPLOWO2_02_FULL_42_9]